MFYTWDNVWLYKYPDHLRATKNQAIYRSFVTSASYGFIAFWEPTTWCALHKQNMNGEHDNSTVIERVEQNYYVLYSESILIDGYYI